MVWSLLRLPFFVHSTYIFIRRRPSEAVGSLECARDGGGDDCAEDVPSDPFVSARACGGGSFVRSRRERVYHVRRACNFFHSSTEAVESPVTSWFVSSLHGSENASINCNQQLNKVALACLRFPSQLLPASVSPFFSPLLLFDPFIAPLLTDHSLARTLTHASSTVRDDDDEAADAVDAALSFPSLPSPSFTPHLVLRPLCTRAHAELLLLPPKQ